MFTYLYIYIYIYIYTVGSTKKLTYRNRTYESTDELPTALLIVVRFVVRFEVRSVLRMCVIVSYEFRYVGKNALLSRSRSRWH